MQTALIIVGVGVGLAVILLLALTVVWMNKQNLVGSWVMALLDGTHVTMQFEGEREGGLYKQLARRGEEEAREFGHWTLKLGSLQMIIMATDQPGHPRIGDNTQYWLAWEGKDVVQIDGPDRPKWKLSRATDDVKLDFELDAPDGPPAPPASGSAAT